MEESGDEDISHDPSNDGHTTQSNPDEEVILAFDLRALQRHTLGYIRSDIPIRF